MEDNVSGNLDSTDNHTSTLWVFFLNTWLSENLLLVPYIICSLVNPERILHRISPLHSDYPMLNIQRLLAVVSP